jgi:hypothetical protein
MMAGGVNDGGGGLDDMLDVKAAQSIAFTRPFSPTKSKNI